MRKFNLKGNAAKRMMDLEKTEKTDFRDRIPEKTDRRMTLISLLPDCGLCGERISDVFVKPTRTQ